MEVQTQAAQTHANSIIKSKNEWQKNVEKLMLNKTIGDGMFF